MNEPAIAHFTSLVWVLTQCASEGVELLEHRCHQRAFGSFEVVLARGRQQVRLVWDGRDSILSLYYAKEQNAGVALDWVHDADFSVPGAIGLYQAMCSRAIELLAT